MFKKLFLILSLSLISIPAQSDTPRYWRTLYSDSDGSFLGEVGSLFLLREDPTIWGYRHKFMSSGTTIVCDKLCKRVQDGIITKEVNNVAYTADGMVIKVSDKDWRLFEPGKVGYGLCNDVLLSLKEK